MEIINNQFNPLNIKNNSFLHKQLIDNMKSPELYCILGDIDFHLEHFTEAEKYFRMAIDLFANNRSNFFYYSVFSYGLSLVCLGRSNEALNILNTYYLEILEKELFVIMLANKIYAQIYLNIKDYHKAIEYAQKAIQPIEEFNALFELSQICAVLATSYIELGNEKKAFEYASRSMEWSKKENYIQDYIMFSTAYKPLFEFCLNYNIQRKFVESIQERIKKNFESIDVSKDVHIYVSFFGDTIVQVKEKIIKWRTSKAKNIFFYILINNKKGVTREKLIDIFFEYYDLDKTHTNLKTTLCHIRKAFREHDIDNILICINGRYFINNDNITTDIDKFNSIIKAIGNDNSLCLELARELCDVYKRSFCEDIDLNDFIAMRENYFSIFESAIMKTITFLNKDSRLDESLEFINILIKNQKYNENYYQMKLDTYTKLNNKIMANRTKEELRVLYHEMGINELAY